MLATGRRSVPVPWAGGPGTPAAAGISGAWGEAVAWAASGTARTAARTVGRRGRRRNGTPWQAVVTRPLLPRLPDSSRKSGPVSAGSGIERRGHGADPPAAVLVSQVHQLLLVPSAGEREVGSDARALLAAVAPEARG